MKLGIVGLGRMGAAISRRLRQQGFDVTGWDQNAKANEAMATDGLRIAANARGVAAVAEVVISSITEDHGVEDFHRRGWVPRRRRQGQAVHRDEHIAADDRPRA